MNEKGDSLQLLHTCSYKTDSTTLEKCVIAMGLGVKLWYSFAFVFSRDSFFLFLNRCVFVDYAFLYTFSCVFVIFGNAFSCSVNALL